MMFLYINKVMGIEDNRLYRKYCTRLRMLDVVG